MRPSTRGPARWSVPSLALGLAVDALIARKARWFDPYYTYQALCERAKIQERVLYGWPRGERPEIGLDMADRVLMHAGLFWWEVWTEETVRVPLLVVTTYAPQTKHIRGGGRKRFRVKVRTIGYGDAGPDHARLAEIHSLMVG